MAETGKIFLRQAQIGPMANFVYLIGDPVTRKMAVVDPAWDVDAIRKYSEGEGYEIDKLLLTHYHPDHLGGRMMGQNIEGAAKMLEQVKAKVYVNKHEADGVKQVAGLSDSDMVKVDAGYGQGWRARGQVSAHARTHAGIAMLPGRGQSEFRRYAVRQFVRAGRPAGLGSGGDVSQPERHAAKARRLDGSVSGACVLVGIEHHDRRPEASQHVHAISDA